VTNSMKGAARNVVERRVVVQVARDRRFGDHGKMGQQFEKTRPSLSSASTTRKSLAVPTGGAFERPHRANSAPTTTVRDRGPGEIQDWWAVQRSGGIFP